jgi:DNA-binding NtrC family response regulator
VKSRSRLAFNTSVADSAEHAYRLLDTQNIDVVLLDLKLPGAGGLEALHQISERKPDAVIVVVTGYGTVQSAVQAMKKGAYDYVTKPFSMEELRMLLQRVSGHLKLKTENRTLREKIKSKLGFGSIVGRAPEMISPEPRRTGRPRPVGRPKLAGFFALARNARSLHCASLRSG